MFPRRILLKLGQPKGAGIEFVRMSRYFIDLLYGLKIVPGTDTLEFLGAFRSQELSFESVLLLGRLCF